MSSSELKILLENEEKFQKLRKHIPKIEKTLLNKIQNSVLSGKELSIQDKLLLFFIRLVTYFDNYPKSGDETFKRLVDVMYSIECDFFYQSLAVGDHISTIVKDAFIAYDIYNYEYTYNEKDHNPIYSKILKPPAKRYAKKGLFEGKEIITQLSHITIIDQITGAIEIQEIDKTMRSRLKENQKFLVEAIINDEEYFKDLPNKSHLVIFRQEGFCGTNVWDN